MAAARATCLMMPANFFKRSRVCRAAEPVSSVAMANRNYKRNSYRMSRNLQRKKIKGRETKSKDKAWTCISGCGACCKLAKGPLFDSPEDIFDNPKDIALYRSLIGPDGWCIHYQKDTHTCSIYNERPYFCRAKPDVFNKLYGIETDKFIEEACRACRDTITAVYGSKALELERFNETTRNLSS
eukprot:TRINITY_DN4080_c0_g1_i2.p1 TRINITY_DN4080_c0_g1~~TRINITY_DN4080_c0_g1_i2.p1  ORF type:complete len:201 (-),score=16.42 TRINITY_DN4080_c0_g1_i2:642-1193(-)